MTLAGHSSPRAAMIYQHAAEDRAAAVAAAMSKRLSATGLPESDGPGGTSQHGQRRVSRSRDA